MDGKHTATTRRQFLGATAGTTLLHRSTDTNLSNLLTEQRPQKELVTLDHLERLHDTLETPDGKTLHYWWIYAEPDGEFDGQPPASADYNPVPAPDEGVSALDDVARIAVVYLRHYRQYGDRRSLTRARHALDFVRFMQLDSGKFLNFVVDPDTVEDVFGTETPDVVEGVRVNGTATSYPSLGWWAARACWALGEGYRVFKEEDPKFAAKLESSLQLLMDAWAAEPLQEYGNVSTNHGMKAPDWALGEGTDATSPAVLGLASYADASGDSQAVTQLRKFAEALELYQFGDETAFPFEAHLPWTGSRSLWHAWGSRQSAALARAGAVLGESTFLESARDEVTSLFTHLLASYVQIRAFFPAPTLSPQIAYGANAIEQGCYELWRATDEPIYLSLAGLAASWFRGNNVADAEMYQPTTGRGFDGLSTDGVNWNAGAESTLCAVLSILETSKHPLSTRTLTQSTAVDGDQFRTVEAETGSIVDGSVVEGGWTGESLISGDAVELESGGSVELTSDVDAGAYRPYVVFQRQETNPDGRLTVESRAGSTSIPVGTAESEYYGIEALDALDLETGERFTVSYEGPNGTSLVIDQVVLQPTVEHRTTTDGEGTHVALANSMVDERRHESVGIETDARSRVVIEQYDTDGNRVEKRTTVRNDGVSSLSVAVPPTGFTFMRVVEQS